MTRKLRVGDALIADMKSGYAYETIVRSEVEELLLEETPNVNYEDIGGLSAQIEQLKTLLNCRFCIRNLYVEHGLKPPKGLLLYAFLQDAVKLDSESNINVLS